MNHNPVVLHFSFLIAFLQMLSYKVLQLQLVLAQHAIQIQFSLNKSFSNRRKNSNKRNETVAPVKLNNTNCETGMEKTPKQSNFSRKKKKGIRLEQLHEIYTKYIHTRKIKTKTNLHQFCTLKQYGMHGSSLVASADKHQEKNSDRINTDSCIGNPQ